MNEKIKNLNKLFNLSIDQNLEITNKENIKYLGHVPRELYDFYKKELMIKKVLLNIVNKNLLLGGLLDLDSGETTLRMSLHIAKNGLYKTEIECLESLISLLKGYSFASSDLTKEIYDQFNYKEIT